MGFFRPKYREGDKVIHHCKGGRDELLEIAQTYIDKLPTDFTWHRYYMGLPADPDQRSRVVVDIRERDLSLVAA